jgi:hypothetical protein
MGGVCSEHGLGLWGSAWHGLAFRLVFKMRHHVDMDSFSYTQENRDIRRQSQNRQRGTPGLCVTVAAQAYRQAD